MDGYLVGLLWGLVVYFGMSYQECIKFKQTTVFGTTYYCEIRELNK